MATTPFKYQARSHWSGYNRVYLLTKDYVSVSEFRRNPGF